MDQARPAPFFGAFVQNGLEKKLLAGLPLALWLPIACADVAPETDTSDARKAELYGEAIDGVVDEDHEVASMVPLERAARELDMPHLRALQVQIIERVGWEPTPKQVEEALHSIAATYSDDQLEAAGRDAGDERGGDRDGGVGRIRR